MSYYYEASNVTVNWLTLDLASGWAEDTFLKITPNAARVEHKAGAGGTYSFSKIADKGCTIEMTFADTAPINSSIGTKSGLQDLIGNTIYIAPFLVVDSTGDSVHFVCLNAVMTEVPEITFGRASGTRTWKWVSEMYIMAEDLTTVTALIDSYIL